jgi:hypothetical protein
VRSWRSTSATQTRHSRAYGAILIASNRARDEELVDGMLEIGPLEAAIVATAEPG